jgi:drug/metabolite transporter (DMT)-like permease
MVMATLFLGVMSITVKILPRIPVFEIIFFRSIVTLVMTASLVKKKKLPFWGNNKKILILRGVFGSAGLLLFFITLKSMPLASAVTIQYLSPIFSTLLAIVILSQPMPAFKWLFYIVAFVGAAMVKGFDERVSTIMLLVGISSAVFSGLAYNMIAKLKGQDDPLTVVMYFPLVTVPLILIPTIYTWVTPTWVEFLWLIGMGISTQLGQLFMTKAFQAENVGKIAIFQYLGIVWALTFGYFLFDETFGAKSLVGMLLVVAGVVLSVLYGLWEKKKLSQQA